MRTRFAAPAYRDAEPSFEPGATVVGHAQLTRQLVELLDLDDGVVTQTGGGQARRLLADLGELARLGDHLDVGDTAPDGVLEHLQQGLRPAIV